MFQFQLGAIGSYKRVVAAMEVARVSIPAWCDWEYLPNHAVNGTLLCFNSSLVRLGEYSVDKISLCNKFQFQLGAIGRRIEAEKEVAKTECFNSSLVRLGVAGEFDLTKFPSSFNSSLVRLGVSAIHFIRNSDVFQFQLGAIGRIVPAGWVLTDIEFQFQLGAIGRI